MTEPTWKDPLLAKWSIGMPEYVQYRASECGRDDPLSVLERLQRYVADDACKSAVTRRTVDRQRRALIIDLCPSCKATADEDCAPDCRLAKVIGEKP